jgi:glycosyltransferase involved in cell wall biosynthesis
MSRVTAIMSFYETPAAFLEEAIESVLAQTYGDWELTLVNDGSTGECVATATRYAERHPQRIRLRQHAGGLNRGLIASRELGIRHSDAEYVAFLDADDVWLPNKLEDQVALLNAHPDAQMLYGNTVYWHGWSGRSEDAGRDYMPDLGVETERVVAPPQLLPLFLEGKAAVPCTCSVMLRRRALGRFDWEESRLLDNYEDQVLYAKVCLEYPVYVSSACWDKYRQHPGSMCASAERGGREDEWRRIYLEWLLRYVSERSVAADDVRRVAERELWMVQRPRLGRWLRRLDRVIWKTREWRVRSVPG